YLTRADRISLDPGPSPLEEALGSTRVVYAATKPANDLLGLRDDVRYRDWLGDEWGSLAPDDSELSDAFAARDLLEDVARSRVGSHGTRIDYAALAPLLSQAEYLGDAIEVPSLTVLAAWGLERELQRRSYLGTCATCERSLLIPAPASLADALADQRHC